MVRTDIEVYRDNIAKAQKKQEILKEQLAKLDEKLSKNKKLLNAELEKKRTQNCRKMGELIYARFGDDITPDEFEEMITFILLNNEIRRYVESEKKKRKAAERTIAVDTDNNGDMVPDQLTVENAVPVSDDSTGADEN